MKIKLITECRYCANYEHKEYSLGWNDTFYCSELGREVEPKGIDKECPLPDADKKTLDPWGVIICDECSNQEEGKHYCLLHSKTVLNMDISSCDDFTPIKN